MPLDAVTRNAQKKQTNSMRPTVVSKGGLNKTSRLRYPLFPEMSSTASSHEKTVYKSPAPPLGSKNRHMGKVSNSALQVHHVGRLAVKSIKNAHRKSSAIRGFSVETFERPSASSMTTKQRQAEHEAPAFV